MDLPEEFILK